MVGRGPSPNLCELALAGAEDDRRSAALAALIADRNLRDHTARRGKRSRATAAMPMRA